MKTSLSTKIAAAAASTGLALAALMGVAGPAHAADTTATFTITAGGLSVTAPTTTVALGSVASGVGNSVAGKLGAVTVSDTRGALAATWITSVSSTNFTTGTATANETVSNASIAYGSGAATAQSGTGTFVAGTAATLATAGTAAAWTVGTGNNSASWNPTLTFTLLGSQVTGTYSGTITHSVA